MKNQSTRSNRICCHSYENIKSVEREFYASKFIGKFSKFMKVAELKRNSF